MTDRDSFMRALMFDAANKIHTDERATKRLDEHMSQLIEY